MFFITPKLLIILSRTTPRLIPGRHYLGDPRIVYYQQTIIIHKHINTRQKKEAYNLILSFSPYIYNLTKLRYLRLRLDPGSVYIPQTSLSNSSFWVITLAAILAIACHASQQLIILFTISVISRVPSAFLRSVHFSLHLVHSSNVCLVLSSPSPQ